MTFQISALLISLAQILYAVCAVLTFVLGMNSLVLSFLYLRHREKIWKRPTPAMHAGWPSVTIQLPVRNENTLVVRLLKAIARLEYPAHCLQIQVLDDSTDQTSQLLQQLVQQYQQAGLPIEYYQRPQKFGYKAGNLNFGLQNATGELVAVFDADFEPPSDWLKQVVPFFQDPRIGLVQTRYIHRNYRRNLLTRMAAIALDSQMIIEYTALSGAEMLVNFLGTAGIWRRRCLDERGGWQTYTLTEDIDMAIASQVNGWKGIYLPRVVSQAELPEKVSVYKTQQYRWSRGFAQAIRRQVWKIARAPWPFINRLEILTRCSYSLLFPAIMLMLLLVLPVGLTGAPLLLYLGWTPLGGIGPLVLFSMTRSEAFPRLRDRLLALPLAGLVGMGLTVECSLGVIRGLLMDGGNFYTTPKSGNTDPNGRSRQSGSRKWLIAAVEVLIGCYLVYSIYVLWPTIGILFAPWLLTSAAVFWFMAAASILDK